MTTQKPKQELCNAELKLPPVALYVGYLDDYYGRRLNVYAGNWPDGAARVVGKCGEPKGHDGRCKAGKLKYEITVEWWK